MENEATVAEVCPPVGPLQFYGTLEAQCALLDALAKARVEFGEVRKDKGGQRGNQTFKYAPLDHLTAASIGPLSKAGISVIQPITVSDRLTHHRIVLIVSGCKARIQTYLDFLIPTDPQEYGRVTTYYRRYMYNAFFVLDGEADADEVGGAKGKAAPPEETPLENAQVTTIKSMFKKLGIVTTDECERLTKLVSNGKTSEQYTKADGAKLIRHLGSMIDEKKKNGEVK